MQKVTFAPDPALEVLPDHTQLPETDGTFVQNYQEYPQSELLSSSLLPRLHEIHPDGQFAIGQDSGIYWRLTDPPLKGCKAPDWCYIPGVPPMLDGKVRRSYVLWKEHVHPRIVVEYVSGDGSEERDRTPNTGKFWVYENGISAEYYAIFDVQMPVIEVYQLVDGHYVLLPTNAAGRIPFPPLGVEFGLWEGTFRSMTCPWMRVWDSATGLMLPSFEEGNAAEKQRAEKEKQRAEKEKQRAKKEKQRADTSESLLDDTRKLLDEEADVVRRMAQKLRELGVDPGTV
jgi:Uma2 family endonuclease